MNNWVKIIRISFYAFAFVISASLTSCASLSKSQMSTIQSFAGSCDSFAKYPSALFEEIAKIRAERGCFYAASLSDPALRIKELNSINEAFTADIAFAKKMDLSFEILNTYQRALKSLSHNNRYNNTGREFRSLGRNLDSLINRYNFIDVSDPLPLGIGKAVGKIVGYGAEIIVRNVQTNAVREYVIAGDSLVGAISASIVDILSSQAVTDLVDNEIKGLEANYISYLKSGMGSLSSSAGRDFSGDKAYLSLLGRADGLKKQRSGIVSAAKALAKAHNKIAIEVVKRKKLNQVYQEIKELDDELSALRVSLNKVTF